MAFNTEDCQQFCLWRDMYIFAITYTTASLNKSLMLSIFRAEVDNGRVNENRLQPNFLTVLPMPPS